jgi:hypothetical protein
MLIFFLKTPNLLNFNPQKRKSAIFVVWASSANPKQQTELSKHDKIASADFYHTK